MNIKFQNHEFEIFDYPDDDYPDDKYYYYVLYKNKVGIYESDEMFDTLTEAEFAAIGHIGLLEDGEG
jgi:hypothetical protein